jgi:hypothetical protein
MVEGLRARRLVAEAEQADQADQADQAVTS